MPTTNESLALNIFSLLGRPVFLVDQGNRTLNFINSSGEELTGFNANDIVGKDWKVLFDEPSIPRVDALIHILETNRKVKGRQELQLVIKRRTGRSVQINLIVSLVEDLGRGTLIFDLEDLSPILSLQAEKESLRAEMGRVSKLADIGRLTGGIAHELNNPLAILQGLSENMSDLVDQNCLTRDKLLQELLPMQATITRMSRIIQSMMSVARGEEPIMENIPIVELWDKATAGFLAVDQLRYVKVVSNIDQALSVPMDSIRIEQIFVNLVKNALHALGANKLGDREIRVTTVEQKERIQINVENNGPPIPEKVGENIYTPFFTTKPVGEGYGLGLFLAYNVMKAHGGSLTHENLKPRGVRFTLSFPKKRAMISTQRFRVLIVDDEALFRQNFARKLEGMGLIVTMARDGSEALKALNEGIEYDLIITDFRMPGMDGGQLVDEVRKNFEMPILFVTGFSHEGAIQKFVESGVVQGSLQKPVQDRALIRGIESALGTKLLGVTRTG